jgi:hypothetical protein
LKEALSWASQEIFQDHALSQEMLEEGDVLVGIGEEILIAQKEVSLIQNQVLGS